MSKHFVCPKCDRPLTKEKSWHYCQKISVEDLFKKKPEVLLKLFKKLQSKIGKWEDVSYSATKNCIVFIATKTFLVIRVMKDSLDLKFVLPEDTDEFPIYKKQTYGKKTEYYIRLHDESDLDGDVFRLLKSAYNMMNS